MEIPRELIVKEITSLKVSLDQANKLKNEKTNLLFLIEGTGSEQHLFATTGQVRLALLYYSLSGLWWVEQNHNFQNLGKFLRRILNSDCITKDVNSLIYSQINLLYPKH